MEAITSSVVKVQDEVSELKTELATMTSLMFSMHQLLITQTTTPAIPSVVPAPSNSEANGLPGDAVVDLQAQHLTTLSAAFKLSAVRKRRLALETYSTECMRLHFGFASRIPHYSFAF